MYQHGSPLHRNWQQFAWSYNAVQFRCLTYSMWRESPLLLNKIWFCEVFHSFKQATNKLTYMKKNNPVQCSISYQCLELHENHCESHRQTWQISFCSDSNGNSRFSTFPYFPYWSSLTTSHSTLLGKWTDDTGDRMKFKSYLLKLVSPNLENTKSTHKVGEKKEVDKRRGKGERG